MKPLSYELNSRILKLAPKYTPSAYAPDTFERLARQSVAGLVVWDGASETSIYADPMVNFAFRAWHDALHIKLNAPFNELGETMVAIEQARLLKNDGLGRLITIEVIEQFNYFKEHGTFPADQLDFALTILKKAA